MRAWFCCRSSAVMLLAASLFSAASADPSSDFLLDVWDTESKLPNSSVTSIAQSADGYLWIGTYNGLARFDGVRFITFDPLNTPELAHARIQDLFTDESGRLWISTYRGELATYANGRFRKEWPGQGEYDARTTLAWSSGHRVAFIAQSGAVLRRDSDNANWKVTTPPPVRLIFRCAENSGRAWFTSRDGGVFQADESRFIEVPSSALAPQATVLTLCVDSQGVVWAGTTRGLARWDGKQFELHNPPGSPAEFEASFLLPLRNGGIWVLAGGRLRKIHNGQWVSEIPEWQGLLGSASGRAMGMHEDRSGGVWFNHYGNGLFYIKPDGSHARLTTRHGLPGDRVASWYQNPEGDVWLGIYRGGLARLRKRQFQVIGPAQGLPTLGAYSVCEDANGVVYVGTSGAGLCRLDKDSIRTFRIGASASDNQVFSLLPLRKGGLLLSAAAGEDLFAFTGDEITRGPWDVHGVKAMIQDRAGRVWIGTKNTLAWYADGKRRLFGSADGIGTSAVRSFAEAVDGTIWCGTDDGTIYRCAPESLRSFRAKDSLAGQPVWSLLGDADGTIWAGTFRGGLLRLKDGHLKRLSTSEGLPGDVVSQILDDGQGHFWLGTHQGICRVSKSSLNACADGRTPRAEVVTFGRLDGLPTLECASSYQPAAWRGRDGRLWFTTIKGVVSVRPEDLTLNFVPPPVVIEEFRADGKPVALPLGERRLPPGHRQYEFQFTALSFSAPDKVRFRYKLHGLDTKWIEADTRRSAQFSHLSPGDYVFEVTACNNDGVWNEKGAQFGFTVLPRFYQTWWFLTLGSIGALAGVGAAVRFAAGRKYRRELARLEQQNAVERDRARIARDIHDDFGAGLTQITLLSELARRESEEKVAPHLDQICTSARHLTKAMDEIVWAVDPEHDTLAGFVDYASAFADEFLHLAGIRCRWDLPANMPEMHVEAETRYNLFLAFKEALNNIVKHAHATEVWIRLRTHEHGFGLVVEDNGHGLAEHTAPDPASRLCSGHGLLNLESRLALIGGSCSVEAVPAQGTRISFKINLKPRTLPPKSP